MTPKVLKAITEADIIVLEYAHRQMSRALILLVLACIVAIVTILALGGVWVMKP